MTVIVGSGQGGENKKKRLLILGIVALLVLAGVAGAGLRWLQNRNDGATNVSQQKGSGFSSTVDDIQSLRAKGDLEGANARIAQGLKDPAASDKERYHLYIQQGNAAVDKQDYVAAIAAYESADAIDKTYETALLLADTWLLRSDKAKATDYYKKALQRVPEGPLQDEEKAALEDTIRSLEGQSS